MKYLAVLGRQPEISRAEIAALLPSASLSWAVRGRDLEIDFNGELPYTNVRLGGTI